MSNNTYIEKIISGVINLYNTINNLNSLIIKKKREMGVLGKNYVVLLKEKCKPVTQHS